MHKLSRALHEWTRNAKKEARQDVNGEMNVFQTPVVRLSLGTTGVDADGSRFNVCS